MQRLYWGGYSSQGYNLTRASKGVVRVYIVYIYTYIYIYSYVIHRMYLFVYTSGETCQEEPQAELERSPADEAPEASAFELSSRVAGDLGMSMWRGQLLRTVELQFSRRHHGHPGGFGA